jgi:hypothetical protein
MATHFKPHPTGTYYRFDETGDGIAMHAHVHPETRHHIRVLSGRVAVYGDGVDTVVKAGEVLRFKSYRAHEIAAIDPGTEIVNELEIPPHGPFDPEEPGATGSVESALVGWLEFPK